MKWVLIIMVAYHGTGRGVALDHVEFETEMACLDAGGKVHASAPRHIDLKTVCVPTALKDQ